MNSPCIVVSQYKSSDRSISTPKGGCGPNLTGWAPRLLNPQWPRRSPNTNPPSNLSVRSSQSDTHSGPFINATEQDIPNIMDRYRNLMFDFTFPETIDFRDPITGQLAATHRSTVVAEHEWKLWELAEILKSIPITLDSKANVAKHIAKIEASVGEVRFWIEEQRIQQLIQEEEENLLGR